MKFSGRLNDMLGSGQRTLGTQVFDDLFSKITTRQWREGEKLPSETDLARHYNVSRPVIRAAIQELRAQGFVTTTKGLGTFVKRCNYDQVSSIRLSQINDLEDMVRCYEYRIALEGKMAYWAALRCNAADRIELQQAFDATEAAYEKSERLALDTDFVFHLTIAEATHNRFFPQAMQIVRLQAGQGMEKVSEYFVGNKARHSSIKSVEHSLILEGILRGDGEMAEAAMVLHLTRSMKWLCADEKNC